MKIPIAKPSITKKEIDAVVKVMESGHLAQGHYVSVFEYMMAEYTGKKYAAAVSSGTDALFLALKSMAVGRDKMVITTPYTFAATTLAICHTGANPFFVDIDPNTYNLDIKALKKTIGGTFNVGAIVPVDVFGNTFDSNKIKGIPVIIDAAESIGSKMDRQYDMAIYSFYPNKILASAEGGMVVSDNKHDIDYIKALRNQGRDEGDSWLTHTLEGYNSRMSDVQAVIAIEQLKRINEILENREEIWHKYLKNFMDTGVIDNIRMQKWERNAKVAPFVLTVEVENRDRIIVEMAKKGIQCRNYFPCVHLQPFMQGYGYKVGDYPNAEYVASRTMALPFYFGMTDSEICYVVNSLKGIMEG